MKKLSQSNIIEAIHLIIEKPKIIKGRQSLKYDLIYEGKTYPPILVLSEANKLAGGEELTLASFGNNTDKAFEILRDNGFEVRLKDPNFKTEYIAWAEKTLKVEKSTQKQYSSNIDKLSEIIDYNIFEKSNIDELEELYHDLIKEQKNVGGKYYEEKRPSASLKGWYSAAVKTYIDFLKDKSTNIMPDISLLNLNQFENATNRVGLTFSKELISRFCASLITKRFLILTGLTGSGKTKIAQSFAEWICESDVQYKIIPVGADWTNREPLLGYPNGLEDKKYVSPDNGALELIINAIDNPNLPFFMILDEMNLSHVERYFADFLSVMESDKNILLYSGDKRGSIPKEIEWPQNLFIIGTVNIDESTYMFSPKVLDRANVIEFRLNHADLKNYFDEVKSSSNESLRAEGKEMAAEFLKLSIEKSFITNKEIQKILLAFFDQLSKVGAEFGYRTAKEIQMLTDNLIRVDSSINQDDIIDIAIMQKLLPKLHGSRSKLIKVLDELLKLCAPDLILEKLFTEDYNPTIKYKLSYEKIKRMYKNAIDNGFASYAEA
jgi:5-methylcytosine-specific restriction protein B